MNIQASLWGTARQADPGEGRQSRSRRSAWGGKGEAQARGRGSGETEADTDGVQAGSDEKEEGWIPWISKTGQSLMLKNMEF